MKKLLSFWILMCLSSLTFALPANATIHFNLTEVIKGDNCPAIMMNAPVVVDYQYDFPRNMGEAHLRYLKDLQWDERMFPLGISKYYAFMSSMQPQTKKFADGEATIFRIIFHIYKDGTARLMMMLNQQGDCIMQSNLVTINYL